MRIASSSATTALLAAIVASTGCATLRTADKRTSDLSTYFAQHPFQHSCEALWPSALRVAATRGFPLSAKDRQILGEAPEGIMAQVISAATQTYRTQDGGLVTETDWNRESGTRLRLNATPAGAQGCLVRYDSIGGGITTADEQQFGPDWELALELLQAVDPRAAAALEMGMPASG